MARVKEVPLHRQLYSAMLTNLPEWLASHVRYCDRCKDDWYAMVAHAEWDLGIDVTEEEEDDDDDDG